MVSSRASFEIVQKALFARTPLVFAVSTASTLSVDLAEEGNPTLIGFMKGERIAIYIHPIGLMFQKTSDSGWVLQNVLSFSYMVSLYVTLLGLPNADYCSVVAT